MQKQVFCFVCCFRKIRELHSISDRVVHKNGKTSLTEHSSSSGWVHRKKEEGASKQEHVNEPEHRVNEAANEHGEHDFGSGMDLAGTDMLSNGDGVDSFEMVEKDVNLWDKDSEQVKQRQVEDSSEGSVRRNQQELEGDGDRSSQPTSDSSSPMLEKSKRVSVHREFDSDYQPPESSEINNVRLQ